MALKSREIHRREIPNSCLSIVYFSPSSSYLLDKNNLPEVLLCLEGVCFFRFFKLRYQNQLPSPRDMYRMKIWPSQVNIYVLLHVWVGRLFFMKSFKYKRNLSVQLVTHWTFLIREVISLYLQSLICVRHHKNGTERMLKSEVEGLYKYSSQTADHSALMGHEMNVVRSLPKHVWS